MNLGDDADTVGAITGQIAGAFYGINDIPVHLISSLSSNKMIESITEELIEAQINKGNTK